MVLKKSVTSARLNEMRDFCYKPRTVKEAKKARNQNIRRVQSKVLQTSYETQVLF